MEILNPRSPSMMRIKNQEKEKCRSSEIRNTNEKNIVEKY